MTRTSRALARATTIFGLTVAGLGLSMVPQAQAVTAHKPLNDTRPVTTGPAQVDFPIEHFGVVADLATVNSHIPDRGRAPFGEARFRVAGRWTPWQALEEDGAEQAGQFASGLVSVDDADAYQVRGLPSEGRHWRAAAINTSDGPEMTLGHRPAGAAVAGTSCMSRADWGADETISGWTRDGDVQEFSPAQVVTIHHTAGSNDPSQDYADTVRAIYSYHVKSRGWSDIGYQYLVGGDGVLYEGRNSGHTSTSCLDDGGDGSDFAHQTLTDEVVTGAHVGGYNTGNVGISVMGCFQPSSSTCTGDTTPTRAAMDAVDRLVAGLSERHGLATDGMTDYMNPVNGNSRTVHTVSGHRDWGQTACPGETLYAQLPSVRTSAVRFHRRGRTVREDLGTAWLLVRRSGNTALPATVDYSVSGGTATPGSDFTLEPGTLEFAAGETRKTFAVEIHDDEDLEGREGLRITLGNPGDATVVDAPATMTVRVAPSDQQPDGLVSRARSRGYVGDDIYNTTADQQRRMSKGRRGQYRDFYVRVSNDGNVANTFTVRGTRPRRDSRVRFYSGGNDVTRAMRSSSGWAIQLEPGSYRMVRIRITVLSRAAIDSLKPARVISSWSGDTTRTDVVAALVRVAS